MKQKITALLAVTVLVFSMTLVYAHSGTQETLTNEVATINDFEDMDELHDLMTQDLEPELKEQMDVMHSFCHGG